MIKYIFIIFFSYSIITAQDTPKNFSVKEAINFALENNAKILNAKLEVDKAYKEKWKIISEGLPQIKADFN